jgi:DNA (cytosine-5)-methyltransferase 1
VPAISAIGEGKAVITHLLENPDERTPFITMEEYIKLIHYLQANDASFATEIAFPPPIEPKFTFIDLFDGIGGFRQALMRQGGRCVFSLEWDKHAAETYFHNYGVYPFGDIRAIASEEIPDHDILCAGFPCQPFSIAGVSKKNSMGRATGFSDKIQGTLFFEIARILAAKRPSFFFLENVKNILSHDNERTIQIIRETLDELDYEFLIEVVDVKAWVPQLRERVFFIGYDRTRFSIPKDRFYIPKHPADVYTYPTLDTVIDSSNHDRTLSDGTWKALKNHKAKHASKANGFGYKILDYPINSRQVAWTISARCHKDGADCLVPQMEMNPRQLSIQEVLRLQGFDDTKFKFPVGITYAYKEAGNSVVVPAIEETTKILANLLYELNIKGEE